MTERTLDRRRLLGALAGAGATTLAGCGFFDREDDAATDAVDEETARQLATEFAPMLYFDQNERWFPTDPRPYESDDDGETVVDGFDALDGYAGRFESEPSPPDPAVFYRAVEYDGSPLSAVQFWLYSAFDQFTTNFHWHDWEVLHVFVDTETGDPQLYVASSHSRNVPNNEFLDPDPDRTPRVLTELGSHSSALSVNEVADHFQRLPTDDSIADITNRLVEGLENAAEFPLAYGLPRDEGLQLPYIVPELDGAPLYEHDRLPSVERSDLVPPDVTVRSFDALASPPAGLPERETGLVFDHEASAETDVTYDLVPSSELEHIESFTGPQLSFEFSVPDFAEDRLASHLTATGTPWKQGRYDNPAADISGPAHRETLAARYDAIGTPAPVNRIVAAVSQTVSADDAPDGEGLTTDVLSTIPFVLVESDPVAVPTCGPVVAVEDLPAGDHRLTVNGAGLAPHSETVSVPSEGQTTAGAGGEIPLVAREDATKLGVDPRGTDSTLTDLAVEDDFAGRLYDAPLSGPDAVYVHGGGAYTTEVRDTDDEVGAFRVNPADEARVRIDRPDTGKASLASFLADIAEETQAEVAAQADDRQTGGSGNAVQGLAQALAAVGEAASRAADRARAGDRGRADESLDTVATRLDRVAQRLAAAQDDLPRTLSNAADNRLDQARRRSEQAREATKL